MERYDLMTARKVGDKTYWTKVGVMFANRDKPGYRLVFEALPLPTLYDGKLETTVMAFPPKERDDGGSAARRTPPATPGDPGDDIPFSPER